MRHSEKGLNQVLEKILRATGKPMDCTQLFDYPEVREHAATANRVSDYLGGMWRRGYVTRVASSESGSRARWSYQWKESALAATAAAAELGVEYKPRLIAERPNLVITEDGTHIQIVMPNLLISIRQTKK